MSVGIPKPSFPKTRITLSGNEKSCIALLSEVYSNPISVYPTLFLKIK